MRKKTNLALLVIPWLVIWLTLTINPVVSGIGGICVAASLHFANLRWKLTIYDYISCMCVSIFSLFAIFHGNIQIILPVSYLCFSVMWLISCLTPVPLTAHYSKEKYAGNDALKNPLFIKTNLFITLFWSGLYLVTPLWTYFILGKSMFYLAAVINTTCPVILGMFTNWFEKWYPARSLTK